jgi:integrase
VDRAAGRLRVASAKTDAGVRQIEILPALRDELAAHKARSAYSAAGDPVLSTRTGRPQIRENVRCRVVQAAARRANDKLKEAASPPLPDKLTPHSLRRTFASLLFALGRTPPEVMDQVGHADPKLTLRIYARAMKRGEREVEMLAALAGLQSGHGPEGSQAEALAARTIKRDV